LDEGLPVAIMSWLPPVNGQFAFRQRILADYLGHHWAKDYLVLVGEALRKAFSQPPTRWSGTTSA
jgi:hypothetical protein